MPATVYQVDAFTSEPFAGNPAAVVIADGDFKSSWMQSVAAEMNLSETAFVRHISGSRFQIRWFTPGTEVDLCGHATVASAHVLWESGTVDREKDLCFESRSGDLPVRSVGDDIELNFPLTPPQTTDPPDELEQCFLVAEQPARFQYCGRSRFDYLLELPCEDDVRNLVVDFRRLKTVQSRGVTVTAKADGTTNCDFVSRFFAPASGVDEDPVTGSAHCCLADYWSRKLQRSDLVAYQVSERGGVIRIEVKGERVLLRGNAVTVLRGELLV